MGEEVDLTTSAVVESSEGGEKVDWIFSAVLEPLEVMDFYFFYFYLLLLFDFSLWYVKN